MSKYPKRYSRSSILKAQKLRSQSTEAERKLWSFLRRNQTGIHFRRQIPIGPYIVDFVSNKAKLIVELDGSQHYSKNGIEDDVRRTAYFHGQGFQVLRFNNVEFLKNPRGVVETIFKHIQSGASDS